MERFVLECTVRAILIASATAVVLRATRAKTAAARHAGWTAVVLLMLLLPVWTAWGPKAAVRALPPAVATISSASTPTPSQIIEPAPRPAVWNWQTYLFGVYLLGAASLLIRLAIGTIRAMRLTTVSCVAPITVGLLRPRIILPECWREWPPAQLDAVLTHERAHVRRHDPLVQWLALFNRAVFWFHPLAWWLERRLSGLAEEACDAVVLERGHDPHDYSGYLVDLARVVERAGRRVNVMGMAMPGSFLPQRVKNIIDGVHPPRISRLRMVCTLAACVISSTMFAAGSLERGVRVPSAAVQAPENAARPDGPSSKSSVTSSSARVIAADPSKLLLAQAQTNPVRPAPAPPISLPAPVAALENAPFLIAMDFDYTQFNRAEYSVHIAVKIPGTELELARNGGAEETSLDFIGEVKDAFGTTAANISEKVSLKLNDAFAAGWGKRQMIYDTRFILLPGKYTMKFLAREIETGRVGTYETSFAVPNLNKPQ